MKAGASSSGVTMATMRSARTTRHLYGSMYRRAAHQARIVRFAEGFFFVQIASCAFELLLPAIAF